MTQKAVQPLVSVVMPVFNRAEFVPEAVESVLSQDAPSFELIVVDDGSTDDIAGIVGPYGDRIRYLRRDTNSGLSASRNYGARAARGQYLAFCDSDDIHLPHRLRVQAAILAGDARLGLVASDVSTYLDGKVTEESTLRGRFDYDLEQELTSGFPHVRCVADAVSEVPENLAATRVFYGRVPALLSQWHIAWAGASMFRRTAFQEAGGFRFDLQVYEDWDLSSRIAKRWDIAYWDAPVALYRQHSAQVTRDAAIASRCYWQVVSDVWRADPRFAAEHPDKLANIVARAALKEAYYNNESGKHAHALRHLADYIRARPWDVEGYKGVAATLRKIARKARGSLKGWARREI